MKMRVGLPTAKMLWGCPSTGRNSLGIHPEDSEPGAKPLDIIQNYGSNAELTDLAIILGGCASRHIKNFEDRYCGHYMTTSVFGCFHKPTYARDKGDKSYFLNKNRHVAIRPVLPLSVTFIITPDATRTLNKNNPAGLGRPIQVCDFGEYPQDIVSDEIYKKLENAYLDKQLKTTGKSYTFDTFGSSYINDDKPFTPQKHKEYLLDDKKYIRVIGRDKDFPSALSNGETVQEGKPYWVEVKPVEWLKDKSGIWMAKKGLVAGIQFDNKPEYNGRFSETAVNSYLQKYFAEELLPQKSNFLQLSLKKIKSAIQSK